MYKNKNMIMLVYKSLRKDLNKASNKASSKPISKILRITLCNFNNFAVIAIIEIL